VSDFCVFVVVVRFGVGWLWMLVWVCWGKRSVFLSKSHFQATVFMLIF
jgi:hypothetical protein